MDEKPETSVSQGGESNSILPSRSGELAKTDVNKTKSVVELPDAKNLYSLAVSFVKSGMFPQAKNPYGVMTIIEYGRELGLPPVSALQTMSLVNGKLAIESKALLSIAIRHGITVETVEKTKERCVLRFTRPGYQPYTETFTWEDAIRIGLTEKDNYKRYPEEMLYWRCVAKGLRAYCPDIILGLYTRDELEDITLARVPHTQPQPTPRPEPAPPAVEVEEVIDVTPEPSEPPVQQPSETTAEKTADLSEDTLLEASISLINSKLKSAGIERQDFLAWLASIKSQRRYVGKRYGHYSLHQGNRDDVVELARTIDRAIATYQAKVGQQEEAKHGTK